MNLRVRFKPFHPNANIEGSMFRNDSLQPRFFACGLEGAEGDVELSPDVSGNPTYLDKSIGMTTAVFTGNVFGMVKYVDIGLKRWILINSFPNEDNWDMMATLACNRANAEYDFFRHFMNEFYPTIVCPRLEEESLYVRYLDGEASMHKTSDDEKIVIMDSVDNMWKFISNYPDFVFLHKDDDDFVRRYKEVRAGKATEPKGGVVSQLKAVNSTFTRRKQSVVIETAETKTESGKEDEEVLSSASEQANIGIEDFLRNVRRMTDDEMRELIRKRNRLVLNYSQFFAFNINGSDFENTVKESGVYDYDGFNGPKIRAEVIVRAIRGTNSLKAAVAKITEISYIAYHRGTNMTKISTRGSPAARQKIMELQRIFSFKSRPTNGTTFAQAAQVLPDFISMVIKITQKRKQGVKYEHLNLPVEFCFPGSIQIVKRTHQRYVEIRNSCLLYNWEFAKLIQKAPKAKEVSRFFSLMADSKEEILNDAQKDSLVQKLGVNLGTAGISDTEFRKHFGV